MYVILCCQESTISMQFKCIDLTHNGISGCAVNDWIRTIVIIGHFSDSRPIVLLLPQQSFSKNL